MAKPKATLAFGTACPRLMQNGTRPLGSRRGPGKKVRATLAFPCCPPSPFVVPVVVTVVVALRRE